MLEPVPISIGTGSALLPRMNNPREIVQISATWAKAKMTGAIVSWQGDKIATVRIDGHVTWHRRPNEDVFRAAQVAVKETQDEFATIAHNDEPEIVIPF